MELYADDTELDRIEDDINIEEMMKDKSEEELLKEMKQTTAKTRGSSPRDCGGLTRCWRKTPRECAFCL